MARSELTKRVLVAAVGIPLVVAAAWAGRWALGPALAFFAAGAAWELYLMAERKGVRPLRLPGLAAAAGTVLIATVHPSVAEAAPLLWVATIFFVLLMALVVIWERGVEGQPLMAIAVTVLGALLPGGAMAHAIFLRHLPVGPNTTALDPELWVTLAGVSLVAYPLAVTWLTDSAAFFAGKKWGQRRLMPSVSPGKTVVGAVAGLLGGLLAGWVMTEFVLQGWLGLGLHPLRGALGGLVIGGISQMGDLAESVWKREAGIKDSGNFFPGHGGILDRMDSLLFTVPAAYLWLATLLPGVSVW